MQYIGFMMNGNEYTIPILKVQEIINMPSLTKIPQAPHYVDGITNLRGKIIPVINLKKLVGMDDGTAGQKVIVVASGRVTFGVLVDSITGVISIEQSDIESAENFMQSHIDQVEGIAKIHDRLVVLLDTKKLIPIEDMSLFEDEVFEVTDKGNEQIEVVRKIEGMGGEMLVKEVMDAKEYFEKKGISAQDPRYAIVDKLVSFMKAIESEDINKADEAIHEILKAGQSDLFKEVGKVTRKLHDAIRSFKEAIDPKLKDFAMTDMPNAVDRLQFVITKTEQAANKTMEIVEKHMLGLDEFATHLRKLEGPEESVQYFRTFKNRFEDDLTEIITTQSFQDITGQTIKKVIKLVGDIEEELVRLVTTFGVKVETGTKAEVGHSETVSQEDVDDLLKDFGF